MAPTPADGTAFASNLGQGTYAVSALAPGYASASQQVTLSGGPLPTLQIRLESTSGILEGQVTDVVSGTGLAARPSYSRT